MMLRAGDIWGMENFPLENEYVEEPRNPTATMNFLPKKGNDRFSMPVKSLPLIPSSKLAPLDRSYRRPVGPA